MNILHISASVKTSGAAAGIILMGMAQESIILVPAAEADLPAMLSLFDDYAQRQLMLPRTEADLRANMGNFIVAKSAEGVFVGAAALRPFGEGYYEVRSLAVARGFINAGVGSRLVEALLAKARALEPPARCVFALTKRPNLFRRLGFRLAYRERFPAKIWADCRQCPKYELCDETAVEYRLDQ